MSQVLASNVLANGLRTEFTDTYTKIRNRQADSRIGQVMDLSIGATNRQHEFAYFNAAPHMEYWRRGDTVPSDAMGSVTFTAYVYEWARRIKWSKFDRADDQTQSLMDAAKMAGESAALLPERFFFDLLNNSSSLSTTLPAVPTAPDGVSLFSATDGGGGARFGYTGGNLVSGGGITTTALVQADYYKAITAFMGFQDGKGQPLLSPESIAAGTLIICSATDLQIMEAAFLQKIQGTVYGSNTAAAGVTNLVQDASRNIELWASPRLATGDWYVCLKNTPKKPFFLLDRDGLKEYASLEGDNNSDTTRNTGEEFIQWEVRQGAATALPYGIVKVNN